MEVEFDQVLGNMKLAWKIWVPGMLFIFCFVPPQLRLLCVNVIGFVWGVIQSVVLDDIKK